MALYSLSDFKELVIARQLKCLNTARLIRTLDKLGWDDTQLLELLTQLDSHDFQKTVKNCRVHELVDRELIDADQYEIHWDEETRTRQPSSRTATVSLSLKISIYTDLHGQIAGLVTIHLSGAPW